MDESTPRPSGRQSRTRQRARPRPKTASLKGGRRGPVASAQRAKRGGVTEVPVNSKAPTCPSPRSPEPEEPLPHDVFETLVNALADALVLDYQHDRDAMVDSPRRKGRDPEKRGA